VVPVIMIILGFKMVSHGFCGGSDYAKLGQSSDGTYDGCYMPCTGDDKQVCGGSWRNNVYSISPYEGSYQDAGTTKLKNLYHHKQRYRFP